MPIVKKALASRLGSANGNAFKNLLLPNNAGRFSAGFAKIPPNEGPKMEPSVHTRGMTENAGGCNSFWGTISATMVRIIPTDGISTCVE